MAQGEEFAHGESDGTGVPGGAVADAADVEVDLSSTDQMPDHGRDLGIDVTTHPGVPGRRANAAVQADAASALFDDPVFTEEPVTTVATRVTLRDRAGARVRSVLDSVALAPPWVRVLTDIAALYVAKQLVLASFMRIPTLTFLLTFLPIIALARLYSPTQGVNVGSVIKELPRFVVVTMVAAPWMSLLMAQQLDLTASTFTASVSLVSLVVCRIVMYVGASAMRRRGFGARKTLVVGHGSTVQLIVDKIDKHPELGLRVVGVMGDADGTAADLSLLPDHLDPASWLSAHPEDLPGIVTGLGVQQLILVPEAGDHDFVAKCFLAVDGFKVHASLVPPLQDFLLSPSNVEQIEGIPLISLGRLSYAPRLMPGKRVMDVIGAAAALLLLAPVLAVIALAVKIEDPKGPVFFRQKRAGYRGRYFRMVKFRTMCVDAEAKLAALQEANESDGLLFKMKDDPRVTRVGSFLRRTSLDELPQFVNVLKGEMSLVGPRALPVEIEHFGDLAIKRLNVRPGVTGYWQILGRSDLTYDEMVKLDLAYIQNWSLWVDVQLLLKTVPVLCARRGAY